MACWQHEFCLSLKRLDLPFADGILTCCSQLHPLFADWVGKYATVDNLLNVIKPRLALYEHDNQEKVQRKAWPDWLM